MNWCWWEWGFKFILIKDWIKKLKFFNPLLLEKLSTSIETRACNPHDEAFTKGGWIKEFLKANWEFIIEILRILHWTSVASRCLIFIILFFWLNTIWMKYFNWTKII